MDGIILGVIAFCPAPLHWVCAGRLSLDDGVVNCRVCTLSIISDTYPRRCTLFINKKEIYIYKLIARGIFYQFPDLTIGCTFSTIDRNAINISSLPTLSFHNTITKKRKKKEIVSPSIPIKLSTPLPSLSLHSLIFSLSLPLRTISLSLSPSLCLFRVGSTRACVSLAGERESLHTSRRTLHLVIA